MSLILDLGIEAPAWEKLKTWPFTRFDDTQGAIVGSGTMAVVLPGSAVVEHFDWDFCKGAVISVSPRLSPSRAEEEA